MMFKIKDKAHAVKLTGGLTTTTKMPCPSYSIPAQACKTGSKLVSIKGSVCEGCYALKGFYRFKQGKSARQKRLDTIYKPHWVQAMTYLLEKRKDKEFFRWHDSGDIQSIMHMGNIMTVVQNTPNTKHWIPTREYDIVTQYVEGGLPVPSNVFIRLSAHMIDGILPTELSRRLNKHENVEGHILVSGVSKDKKVANCPAYKQGGKCGTCRTCWSPKESVIYPFH